MTEIPRIISVDDHVIEPPDLWTSRLPAKYHETGPRVVRAKARMAQAEAIADAIFALIGFGKRLLKPLLTRPLRHPTTSAG